MIQYEIYNISRRECACVRMNVDAISVVRKHDEREKLKSKPSGIVFKRIRAKCQAYNILLSCMIYLSNYYEILLMQTRGVYKLLIIIYTFFSCDFNPQ